MREADLHVRGEDKNIHRRVNERKIRAKGRERDEALLDIRKQLLVLDPRKVFPKIARERNHVCNPGLHHQQEDSCINLNDLT